MVRPAQRQPLPYALTRPAEVYQIQHTVERELRRDKPDFKAVYAEMGKLSKDEAARFAHDLRGAHPSLHSKLIKHTTKAADAATHATLFADEPAIRPQMIEEQAKTIAKASHNLEMNRVVELFSRVPADERGDVLRKIKQKYPEEIEELKLICRSTTDDPRVGAMRDAFKQANTPIR